MRPRVSRNNISKLYTSPDFFDGRIRIRFIGRICIRSITLQPGFTTWMQIVSRMYGHKYFLPSMLPKLFCRKGADLTWLEKQNFADYFRFIFLHKLK